MWFGVPWGGMVSHAHWRLVRWSPLNESPSAAPDILFNVAYFAMYAALWQRDQLGTRAYAVLTGFALSAAIETLQLFSHTRIPSVMDVASNTAGVALGVWMAGRLRATSPEPARRPTSPPP